MIRTYKTSCRVLGVGELVYRTDLEMIGFGDTIVRGVVYMEGGVKKSMVSSNKLEVIK